MALDFLNPDEKVKLPVGGDFVSGSIIGGWYAVVTTAFMSETDLGPIEEAPKPDYVFKRGNYLRYHYKSYEAGKKASDICGQQYPPKQTWLFLCERAKILSMTEEDAAKWSDPISMEVEIATLKSKKRRHELHMISLPAAVAAYANAAGFENPGFDLSELTSKDTVFTDEFQAKMIGAEEGQFALPYAQSVLWQRRAALWKALGENDPTKYNPKGTGSKYDTESDKLSTCLGILARTWKTGIWARLVQVNSPVVDAVFGDESKRLTIPALTEIYENKTAALKVATDELEARKKAKEANGNGNHASAGEKKVPAGITEKDWTEYVTGVKAAIAGMNPIQTANWMKKEVPADMLEAVKVWLA